jgi:hypothetical protein
MKSFYLGTHQPQWLATAGVPLFVSHRRLAQRKTLPRAGAGWALDSGAFTEFALFGTWTTTARRYVTAVRRYDDEIGRLEWAAPQDFTCERPVLASTGLTGRAHPRRTVDNFLELQMLWGDEETSPFMPVLQGWHGPGDYLRCMDYYACAGVDLTRFRLVGVGSVCRRQGSAAVDAILSAILVRDPAIPLRVFGAKLTGLARYGHKLVSADCLSWSYRARYDRPLPGHRHAACTNCLEYTLRWRARVLAAALLPLASIGHMS